MKHRTAAQQAASRRNLMLARKAKPKGRVATLRQSNKTSLFPVYVGHAVRSKSVSKREGMSDIILKARKGNKVRSITRSQAISKYPWKHY